MKKWLQIHVLVAVFVSVWLPGALVITAAATDHVDSVDASPGVFVVNEIAGGVSSVVVTETASRCSEVGLVGGWLQKTAGWDSLQNCTSLVLASNPRPPKLALDSTQSLPEVIVVDNGAELAQKQQIGTLRENSVGLPVLLTHELERETLSIKVVVAGSGPLVLAFDKKIDLALNQVWRC